MQCFPALKSLDSYYFPKKLGSQFQKWLIFICMEKNFHNFCSFELMIHFLAEEVFLNIHLDSLLNITEGA